MNTTRSNTTEKSAMLIFPLAQSFVIFGENAKAEITPIFSIRSTYSYREKTFTETTVIDLYQYYQINAPEPIDEKLDAMIKLLDMLTRSVQTISEELQSGQMEKKKLNAKFGWL
jgi:hypothetical protein